MRGADQHLADGLLVGRPRGTAPAGACGVPPCSACSPGCRPGWKRAKSSRLKRRIWLTTSAKASPTASMAVVLVLGASPSEQASSSGPSSIVTVAARPRRARGPAGDRHDRHAQLGQRGQQADDLLRLAALREDQHHVVAADAAQVAVDRLGRVQAMAGRAGRGQRGHDLLAHQPRLAHAGDDHVPPALKDQLHGPAKLAVEPVGHLGQGAAFGQDHLPGEAELLEGAQDARRRRRLPCSSTRQSLTEIFEEQPDRPPDCTRFGPFGAM